MTEDQIERAARALCRMRGLDPEEPRWILAAQEIRAANQIQQAIKEACVGEPCVKWGSGPYTLQEALNEKAEIAAMLDAATPGLTAARGVLSVEEKLLRSDLKAAEELLRDVHRYILGQSSGTAGSFSEGVARGHLVSRIQWFLGRCGK